MNKNLSLSRLLLPLWFIGVIVVYLKNFPFIPDFFSFNWLVINKNFFLRISFGLIFLGLFNIVALGWGNYWRKLFLQQKNEKPLGLVDVATGIIFLSLLTYFFIIIGLPVKFLAIFLLIGGVILFYRNKVFWPVKNCSPANKISLVYLLYLPFLLIPFLVALAPPTNYDSLVYHLALPEKYLTVGKIVPTPENIFATFPQNGENLYLLALSLGEGIFANLIHFNFLILSLLIIQELANHYHLDSFLSGLIFISTPAFLLVAGHTFIDLTLTFYILMAFYCLESWTTTETFWIYPLGIFLGFIPGIKYTGFIFWFGLTILITIKLLKEKKYFPKYIRLIFFFTLVLLSPYLVRNLIFYHNPLAPFLSSVFPTTISKTVINNYLGHIHSHGLKIKSILGIIKLFYKITFQGWEFGGAYDIIGPLYLATLPGLFFLPKTIFREKKNLLLFILIGFAGWLFTARVLRFLIPVIALGAIAIVLSAEYIPWGKLRKFLYLAVSIVLFHNFLLTSWITGFIDPLNGYSNKQKYLTEKINNSYYSAALWAKKNISRGKILLFGDARSYYWHRSGLTIIAPTVFNFSDLTEQLNKCNNIEKQISFIQSLADYVYLNYPEGRRLGINIDWSDIAKNKKLLKVLYRDENGEIIQMTENKND